MIMKMYKLGHTGKIYRIREMSRILCSANLGRNSASRGIGFPQRFHRADRLDGLSVSGDGVAIFVEEAFAHQMEGRTIDKCIPDNLNGFEDL
jgi:hypothetical protein